MPKKRRKTQQPQKPSPRTTPSTKSLSTLADVMPADVLKRIKQGTDQQGTIESNMKPPSSAPLKPQLLPQSPQPSINMNSSVKVPSNLSANAPISKPTSSSGLRISKMKESTKKEALGLAEIVSKTNLKPSGSRRAKPIKSIDPSDWRLVLDAKESIERRTRYAEIILTSLNKTQPNPISINLGIDLGTSFSKVVWRGPDKAYPVCFGDNPANLDDYLVPSIVVFDGLTLQSSLNDKSRLSTPNAIPNFKMCLACVSEPNEECQPSDCSLSNWSRAIVSLPESVELVTATYLAHLISRSKRLVRTHLRKLRVQDSSIYWSANLAVPEKYMDTSPVLKSFEGVLRIAWLMAELFDEVGELNKTLDVIEVYSCAKGITTNRHDLDCFVYPEVAAEVASVTKPRSAKQGLYAFVDVGAGTVDGSVFRFYRPFKDDPSQFTYAASVIRAGAAHVELGASEKLAQRSQQWFRTMKEDGGRARGLTLTPELILDPPFDEALQELAEETTRELIQLFDAAHDKEPGEDKWRDLQLIIGGGGASLPIYVNAARDAFTLKGKDRGDNLTNISLDAPSDFEMGRLARKTFHRFAVAYGLSFHHVNLPEVVLAKDVDPAGPGRVRGPIDDPTKDD